MQHELARPELSFKSSSINLEQTEILRFVKTALSRSKIDVKISLDDVCVFIPLIQDINDLYVQLTFESVNGDNAAKKFLGQIGIYGSSNTDLNKLLMEVIHLHYFGSNHSSLLLDELYTLKDVNGDNLFTSQEALVRFILEFIVEVLDYLIADQKAIKVKSFTSDFKAILAQHM